jgi:hypothetical protein
VRNPGGYGVITAPQETIVNFDGLRREQIREGNFEVDTFTCFHCGGVEHVKARADVNAIGFCRNCMRPICQRCSDLPCDPFEKKLERIERKNDFQRWFCEAVR